MNVGTLGAIGTAAGAPLAQTKGSDADKAAKEAADQVTKSASEAKAESAAGIGQTEQDEQADDRDADGRRLWELGRQENGSGEEEQPESSDGRPKSKDATGTVGKQFDLSG